MGNVILTIYLLIKVVYPSNDIKSIQAYNIMVENAFQSYCFLDIGYELTTIDSLADIVVFPEVGFDNHRILGYTNGAITQNPKFYGNCEILLSVNLDSIHKTNVFIHELYHAFIGEYHNMYDTSSLMYPTYNGTNTELSRYDTLYIRSNFLIDYTRIKLD